MPSAVGILGDKEHDRLVKEIEEYYLYYAQQLRPRHAIMVQDHKLYLGHREDRRQPHEKWRSWSWLGDPSRLTDTEVQSWLEILSSIDPPVQSEGRGTEDEWKARGFERYADYFLTANSWTWTQEMILRSLSIQGMKVIKTGWMERKKSPMRRPTKDERMAWDSAINTAIKENYVDAPPDPESQPEEFAAWEESARAVYPQLPAAPTLQEKEVVAYRGPWIYRPSIYDLLYDPFVENWADMEIIIQRIVKPRSWGEDQVRKGKFDKAQFEKAARRGPDDKRLSEWDAQIASEIGISWNSSDPMYRTSDEYWEVWRQNDQTAPWLIILNRSAIVNVSTQNPFWHRQNPYICIRNTPVEGMALGLGSYHQLRRTFADRLTFRDLLLDGLLLSVMPVFLKSRNLGMPELQRFLTPGAILDVNDPNGLKKGWESMAGFAELMKVGELLLSDENTQLATFEHVQGQQAQVGRVSATEATSRLQQALVKHKKKAERIEEEESAIFPQMFYNAYQYYGTQDPTLAELRRQIVGEDEQDPLGSPEFMVDTFAEDLAKTVKFHGASTSRNKELQAQQIKDWLATVSQMASTTTIPVPILSPVELRAVARRAYELLGQKGATQVFTAEGDAAVERALEAHLLQAEAAPVTAQAQLVQAQATLQSLTAPPQALPPGAPAGNGQAPPEEAMPAEQPPVEQPAPEQVPI